MELPAVVRWDVQCCARCGETHPQMVVRRLTNPPPVFSYWSVCPTKLEPLMFRVRPRAPGDGPLDAVEDDDETDSLLRRGYAS
jgi:hypothetical protein